MHEYHPGTAAIRPRKLRLEASSACQLRCPSCPTTTKAIHPVVGTGLLRLQDFRKLLEDNPWVEEIELSNYGEIFLNPQLPQILEFAHLRGVAVSCGNGANFNHVSDAALEAMVRFRLRRLTCSIDGASQETYRQYRVRGRFERVIRNIERLNRVKQEHGSRYPRLIWQFVVFGHNEHELPAARERAHGLGMDFQPKLSWDSDFSPVRDTGAVKREIGLDAATREEFRAKTGTEYMGGICGQLWTAPQINWDGKVLGCCRNFWGDFGGNAFSDGLLESVNSEKMRYARKMLLGEAPARPDIPCSSCELYLGRKSAGKWVRVTVHRR